MMLWRIGGISQRRNMLTVAYVVRLIKILLSTFIFHIQPLRGSYIIKKMDEQINQYDYHSSICLL
ncbi:hypothetical protein QAB67_13775, partial [Staphylococcus aureus]